MACDAEKLDFETKPFALMIQSTLTAVFRALDAGMSIREIEPALLPAHPGESYGALSAAQQDLAAEIKDIGRQYIVDGGLMKNVMVGRLNAWQSAADRTGTDFGPGQWR